MSRFSSLHDLKTLIRSFHPLVLVETVEEERLSEMLEAAAEELGVALFDWSSTCGLARYPDGRGIGTTAEPGKLIAHLLHLEKEAVYHLKDYHAHLRNAEVIRAFRELCQHFAGSASTIVLSGVEVDLPAALEHVAVRFELALPTRKEFYQTLQNVARDINKRRSVEVDLDAAGASSLLDALKGLSLNQARQAIAYAILKDGRLDDGDVELVRRRKAQAIRDGGLLEYYPPRENAYELGGFGRLKEWLDRARVGFSERARELNLAPPRGILVVGVQGCGKSLAAKVLAKRWKLPLLKLDAGRLFDKYVGESERNFRRAVALAEATAPVVLWIDEIEKGLVSSSGDSADGGVARRVFASFLTWLQEKRADVFVVATANDLSRTPPELLRKGRFDEVFFVDLPTAAEREEIFAIHLRLRRQDVARFDLARLATSTDGFSGAEIEQIVVGGLYGALQRNVDLDDELLIAEAAATVPLSVTRREDVASLRELARERFVPVSSAPGEGA